VSAQRGYSGPPTLVLMRYSVSIHAATQINQGLVRLIYSDETESRILNI
jgi:hypothetical protein